MLIRPRLGFALLALVIVTKSAIAQEQEGAIPSLIKPADAVARMDAEQARETEAYTLGVQTVLWGMQWVKAGQTLRVAAAPLPQGTKRNPVDPSPHGINVWGHARALLTHELRIIETPNTETLYSIAVLDLKDGPIVVVHPDLGERYFRTSIWELHGDAHTISQKKDGAKPPPYALVPSGWNGTLPKGLKTISDAQPLRCGGPPHRRLRKRTICRMSMSCRRALNCRSQRLGVFEQGAGAGPADASAAATQHDTPAELLFFEELCETLKDITLRDDELAFARQAGRIGITLADGFQFEKLDAADRGRIEASGLGRTEHHRAQGEKPRAAATWRYVDGQPTTSTSLDDWLFRSVGGLEARVGRSPKRDPFSNGSHGRERSAA